MIDSLSPRTLAACRRAKTIEADPEMQDFRHGQLRIDVVLMVRVLEKFFDGEGNPKPGIFK